ncbi:MAG: hypothetical protein NT105_18745 [Verrucomicrobia bacterium]|nr:hypothetical protein [Verrucomicrobiota bacterium]
MASNRLPQDLDLLLNLGVDAVDGLDQLEIVIGIKQNTKVTTEPDVLAFKTKKEGYDTLNGQSNAKTAAVTIATSNARGFCTLARDMFKPIFGAKAGSPWTAAGWPDDSVAVPSKGDDLLPLLRGIKKYLTDNPTREINTTEVILTAVRAGQLETALNTARLGRKTFDDALTAAEQERDAAEEGLRTRLRGLIGELEQRLDPLSSHWRTFGLNPPGAPDSPARVTGLTARATGGGEARFECAVAARADRYHFEIKVQGVDEDFRSAGDSVTEPTFVLKEQTPGAVMDVRANASNETGEGPWSATVRVTIT